MKEHHGYSITEMENMLPWERELYISMTSEYTKRENERIKNEQARLDAKMKSK